MGFPIHIPLETYWINSKFLLMHFCIIIYQSDIIRSIQVKIVPCQSFRRGISGLRFVKAYNNILHQNALRDTKSWKCFCVYIYFHQKLVRKMYVDAFKDCFIKYWLISLGVFSTVWYCLIIVDIISLQFLILSVYMFNILCNRTII